MAASSQRRYNEMFSSLVLGFIFFLPYLDILSILTLFSLREIIYGNYFSILQTKREVQMTVPIWLFLTKL